MIKLKDSGVSFNEGLHTYEKDGQKLMGITGLIHAVKNLGNYPDASEHVRNIVIPQAGAKGTALHEAIEMYDSCGIENETMSVKWKEGITGVEHEDTYPVKFGLDFYKQSLIDNKAAALANEYNVTDGKYASNIDNVWTRGKEIILVDTKTNNLDYYPGGKDALKEYLSWQLSIYAYLFELQNKKLKVSELGCNWVNKDQAEFWTIARKTDDEVKDLLSTEWEYADGTVKYYKMVDGEKEYYTIPEPEEPEQQMVVSDDIVSRIAELQEEINLKTAELDGYKQMLMASMVDMEIKSFKTARFTATYTPSTTSKTFDSARFKKDHSEMYAEYQKESQRKESIRLTFNNNQ